MLGSGRAQVVWEIYLNLVAHESAQTEYSHGHGSTACTCARQSRLARECFGEYGPGIAALLAQTKIRSPRTSRRFAGKLPRVAVCTSKPRACSPWHSAGLFRAMEGKPESVGMTFVTRGRRRRCPTLPPDLPRDQCATSRVPCLWSAYWATHPECCLLALAKTGW